MSLTNAPKFEKQNNIDITVFRFDKKQFFTSSLVYSEYT